MNKVMAENFYHDESTEWTFPSVDNFLHLEPEQQSPLESESAQIEQDKNAELQENLVKVESLRTEYQQKIAVLNKLLAKLDKPMAILDKEMLELMQFAIKNAVKKIIYKEVKSDPKIINKIIQELSQLIETQGGILSIYLSQNDYQRLMENEAQPNMQLKINPILHDGDVILKSNFTEIRAIINERIDQVLGTKNV